ncbi:MAG: hypothetical protein JEZ04_10335 [Spirochaetales bacterium]|nr:hypothetical protein [Spirochaetales bacterium]
MKKVLYLLTIFPFLFGCATNKATLSDTYNFAIRNNETIIIDKARDLQTGLFKFSRDGNSVFFMESHLMEQNMMMLSSNYRVDSLIRCNLKTGELINVISAEKLTATRLGKFSISDTGKYLACTAFDDKTFKGLYIIDVTGGQTMKVDGGAAPPESFFFSPDEKSLIVPLKNNSLIKWNIQDGMAVSSLSLNKKFGLIKLSPDKSLFAAILDDNRGMIIDSNDFDKRTDIAKQSELITSLDPKSLAISIDNETIAFTGKQKDSLTTNIYMRGLYSGDFKAAAETNKKDSKLYFSYNGNYLVLVGADGKWEIINTVSGKSYNHQDRISGIIFSRDSNYVLTLDRNGNTVRRIDLDRPEQNYGKLQLDQKIINAGFINNNRGFLAITEKSLIFYDPATDSITNEISHQNKQYALSEDSGTLCYADKNGFALMNLLFNIKIADYIVLNQDDYILKPAGKGYIISERFAGSMSEEDQNLFLIGEIVDLTKPVLPPVISIMDIALTKPFIKEGEALELLITVINSGPGESGNLRMAVESDSRIKISGDTWFPVVQAMGGTQSIRIAVEPDEANNTGKTSLSIRLFEEDFGIEVQGKQLDFRILAAPRPDIILAKHSAEEYSSANNNRIIDLNEIIDVAFYLQNIGRADADISNYKIECDQQGVKFLGYVDSSKEIADKPTLSLLKSGEWIMIKQRYFINSYFKDNNLNFSLYLDDNNNNSLLSERLSLPVNKKLAEQGMIRTVDAAPAMEATTVSIRNIDEPETAAAGPDPAGAEGPYLTVFDFSSNEETDGEVRYITSLVTETVSKSQLFRLIDSEERDRIFKELNFSLSAVSIEENTLEIGKMVPANYMILGTLDKMESSYLVTMKLIKTETGELISSRQSIIRRFEEIPNVVPQITLELINY